MNNTIDIIKVTTDNWVNEGLKETLLCKRAKYAKKSNMENYINPAKESLKNCVQYKTSNPPKYEACKDYYNKVINTTIKYVEKSDKDIKKYCKD